MSLFPDRLSPCLKDLVVVVFVVVVVVVVVVVIVVDVVAVVFCNYCNTYCPSLFQAIKILAQTMAEITLTSTMEQATETILEILTMDAPMVSPMPIGKASYNVNRIASTIPPASLVSVALLQQHWKRQWQQSRQRDRKSTRLNSSHVRTSRMPSSA